MPVYNTILSMVEILQIKVFQVKTTCWLVGLVGTVNAATHTHTLTTRLRALRTEHLSRAVNCDYSEIELHDPPPAAHGNKTTATK